MTSFGKRPDARDAPKIGERIYDGACGSAGFLREAHDYLRHGADGKSGDKLSAS